MSKARPSQINTVLLYLGVYVLISCAPNRGAHQATPEDYNSDTSSNLITNSESTTSTSSRNSTNTVADGASSGGGGYVSENSKLLLEKVSSELSDQILSASPMIFKNMKTTITQKMLADIIKNVRLSPLKNVKRDQNSLMFDFGKDSSGNYIEALQPFFTVYGSIPIKFNKPIDMLNIIQDLRLKLIHEAAHHLKLNEKAADKFGLDLLEALSDNRIYCRSEELQNFPINRVDIKQETPKAAQFLELVIYRGLSGMAIIVDHYMAMNLSERHDTRQWLDVRLEALMGGDKDRNEQLNLWFLQEDFSKWKLIESDLKEVSFKTQQSPLWEGQDTVTLKSTGERTFNATYSYVAQRLRKHTDLTHEFIKLPTKGTVELKCEETYRSIEF